MKKCSWHLLWSQNYEDAYLKQLVPTGCVHWKYFLKPIKNDFKEKVYCMPNTLGLAFIAVK